MSSEFAYINEGIGTMFTRADQEAGHTDEALYGMRVELLDHQCGRTLIRTHYRYEGWVNDAVLLQEADADPAWPAKDKTLVPMWIANRFADVLSAPKIQALPLISLPRGAMVLQNGLPDDHDWVRVRLVDGREGYIRSNMLMPYQAPRDVSSITDETAFREALVRTACSYLGTQYRWGGKSPLGIDCSGLCSTAYLQNGVIIYRDSSMQPGFPVHPIEQSCMKKGDLFYFPGHIAMYIDEDHFIHSTSKGGYFGVVINSFNPDHPHYRPDLKAEILHCGSIF